MLVYNKASQSHDVLVGKGGLSLVAAFFGVLQSQEGALDKADLLPVHV